MGLSEEVLIVQNEIVEMQRYNRLACEKASGYRREIERLNRVVVLREKDLEKVTELKDEITALVNDVTHWIAEGDRIRKVLTESNILHAEVRRGNKEREAAMTAEIKLLNEVAAEHKCIAGYTEIESLKEEVASLRAENWAFVVWGRQD